MSGRGWLTVAFLCLVVGVWGNGYSGRMDACNRGVKDRIVHRDQAQADYEGNTAVADDPDQPARTRRARREQATQNLKAAIAFESRMPLELRRTPAGRRLPQFTCGTASLGF